MGFPDSSVGKEYTCNAGDRSLIPESERSTGEGIDYPLQYSWVSQVALLVKESTYNAGDLGSIPGLGRSPGEGKGYPLQYSGLENSMDFRDQTHTFHSESRVLTTGLPRNSPLKSTLKIVHWCSFQSATIVSFTHIFFFRSVVVIYSFLENCPFHCNFKID